MPGRALFHDRLLKKSLPFLRDASFALKSLFIVIVFVAGSIFQQPSWRRPERWRRTMPRCYFLLSLTNKYQQFLCPPLIHQTKNDIFERLQQVILGLEFFPLLPDPAQRRSIGLWG